MGVNPGTCTRGAPATWQSRLGYDGADGRVPGVEPHGERRDRVRGGGRLTGGRRMRFFNTSGPVVAADHYCMPPLERIDRRRVERKVFRRTETAAGSPPVTVWACKVVRQRRPGWLVGSERAG